MQDSLDCAGKNYFVGKLNKPGDPVDILNTIHMKNVRNNRGSNQCIPYARKPNT